MATVNLGRLKPVFKGAYNSGTAYVIDDIVVYANETYINIQAGTNQQPNTATGYWTKLAAKGSDGTDVGATLANKEIAFKTNAGAVDGIPIGNAGEFLKVNSGATGYEYGAVSSDVVRLATAEHSSNVSEINFYNLTSSTYRAYHVLLEDIKNTDGDEICVQFLDSSNNNLATSNYHASHGGFYNVGSGTSGSIGGRDVGSTFARLGNFNVPSDAEPRTAIINLWFGQLHLNKEHSATWTAQIFDPNGDYDTAIVGSMRYQASTVVGGLKFRKDGSSGSISGYKITIWGYK